MKTPKLLSLVLLFALLGSSALLVGCVIANLISLPMLACGEALVFLLVATTWFAERATVQAEQRRMPVPIKCKQDQVVLCRRNRRW